jgi:hypothetical protein
MAKPEIPTLFVHWESFLGWLLDHTERFPKHLRFTLTGRIDNLALDIYERIVAARYRRDRIALLERINLDLELLRLLLRLAHNRRVLDHRSFAYACASIDTAGRMVGGWLRQQRGGARGPAA